MKYAEIPANIGRVSGLLPLIAAIFLFKKAREL